MKAVFLCLVGLTVWGLLVVSWKEAIDIPQVYMTYPDMDCVTVQGGESDENCDNMPPRFTVVYVDPRWAGFSGDKE